MTRPNFSASGVSRRAVLATGSAALGLVAAACGAGGGAQTQQSTASKAEGKIIIMSRADQSIHDLFKAQVAAFTAENPKIQVEIDHQEQAVWLEKFKTAVASGVQLDSCFANDGNAVPFARDGLTDSIDEYLARTKEFKAADYVEGAWFAMTYKGKRYGVPWDSGAYALFYNMDLLDAAGVPYPDSKKRMTWDELLTIARRLTMDGNGRRAGESGFDPNSVKQYGFATSTSWGLAHFVHSNGGEMLSTDGKVLLDQPAALEAIQFVADLGARHFVRQAPQYVPNPPIGFRTNNLAMDHNGAWNIGRFATDVKRVGVAPAPFKKNQTSSGHYSPLVMTKHSKNKDATWAWMYFSGVSEKGLTILSDAGQIQPPRKSLNQRFVNPPANNRVEGKYRQVFVDELNNRDFRVTGDKNGSFWGGVPGWGPTLGAILTPVFRGEKTAASVAGELKRYVEQHLTTLQAPVIQ